MERADRRSDTCQSRFFFRQHAGALVGPEQIPAFHQRQARAAFVVPPNLASRTDRKLALAYGTQPFELWRVIPDIIEFLPPQIPRRLGQLHARKNISIRRNVTTVVARAARQVFVSRAFDSARNGAAKRRRQSIPVARWQGTWLWFAGMQQRI